MNTNLNSLECLGKRVFKWGVVCLSLAAIPLSDARHRHKSPCQTVAQKTHVAEVMEAYSEMYFSFAKANTLPDRSERYAALREARLELREARYEALDRYKARRELCEDLQEGYYHPEIDPDNFCTPEEIAANPNPYRPLIPGTTYVYESETDEGTEVIRVTVTHETREILGIECIVVNDVVFLDGVPIEDTDDWFTQDKDGNVWYFGEISFNYEDGVISDLDGSWEAGVDGAKPGIIMFADPVVGTTFRQEYAVGEAEDVGRIEALGESVETTYMDFEDCLKTADFTPIDPDVIEYKYYAPGVGFVLELKPGEDGEDDEVVQLVDIETE